MGPRIPSPWVNRRGGAEGISGSEPLACLPERQEEATVLACSIYYLSTEMLAPCAPRRPGLGFLWSSITRIAFLISPRLPGCFFPS